jgi:hypothetical protein
MSGWIGVDLDGCLAVYGGWKGPDHIGEPVPAMLARVKQWLAEGKDVRIFTARVAATGHWVASSQAHDDADFATDQVKTIQDWTERHLGVRLPVTATKDYGMEALYDDRAVQIEFNTGRIIGRDL